MLCADLTRRLCQVAASNELGITVLTHERTNEREKFGLSQNGYSGPDNLSDSNALFGAARGVDAVFS